MKTKAAWAAGGFVGGFFVALALIFFLSYPSNSLKMEQEYFASIEAADQAQAARIRASLPDDRLHSEFAPFAAIMGALPKPDWQKHIDWAFASADSGPHVDCIGTYISIGEGTCVIAGGRRCAIQHARAMLKGPNPNTNKVRDSIHVTQCHSDSGKDALRRVAEGELFAYVRNHP